MEKYKSLKEIVEQLELPKYQTKDGLHDLVDNAAFAQLKEISHVPISEIIEDLRGMSNNYLVCNQSYVIPKSVIDMYIEYLENKF
jgi:hypothetical protein